MAQKKFYKNAKKESYVVPDAPQAILDMPIEDAGFHFKTLEVLQRGGLKTIKDVASRNERQLFKLQNFNKKSLADVQKVLAGIGLSIAAETQADAKNVPADKAENGEKKNEDGAPKKKLRPKVDYVPPIETELLLLKIEESEKLSDRTKAALIKRGINTLGDLAMKTSRDLFFIREMGKSGNFECVAFLKSFGLTTRPVEEYEPEVETKPEKVVEKEKKVDAPAKKEASDAHVQKEKAEKQDRADRPKNDRERNDRERNERQNSERNEKHNAPVERDQSDRAKPKKEVERRQINEELPELRKYCSGGKYGYKNSKGEVVIPPVYDEISPFKEGFAAVEVNDMFGYIDENNNMVVEPQYECAMSFSEGLACVTRYGKCGYINTNGEVVIPFKYDAGTPFENGSCRVKADSRWGELGLDGEVRWIK